MNIEAILESLAKQVSEVSHKMDMLISEKAINENSSIVMALNEAKKGNYKALQIAAKQRYEQKPKNVECRKS